ncbi:hypothetical protein ACFL51_01230 [Myxococcota bacterium]
MPRRMYQIGDKSHSLLKSGDYLRGTCLALAMWDKAQNLSRNRNVQLSIAAYNVAVGLKGQGCKPMACSWLKRAFGLRRASKISKRIGSHCKNFRRWGCGGIPSACN